MTSSAARGYGEPHRQLRSNLIADATSAEQAGYPRTCPRCLDPILPTTQPLELDHTDDRTSYLGLSHKRCNRQAAAAKTNSRRTTSRDW